MLRVVLLALVFASASAHGGGNTPYGTAGDYDMTMFARFWMGEPASETACTAYGAENLTLHGLWPQYNVSRQGHPWPQFCNKTSPMSTVADGTHSHFDGAWSRGVAVSYPEGSSYKYTGLAGHEWSRHGVCWSDAINHIAADDTDALVKVQTAFFDASLNLMQQYPTPPMLGAAMKSGEALSLSDVQNAFGGESKVALACASGSNGGAAQLSMVSLCMSKDLTSQVDCPASILSSNYDNSCVSKYSATSITTKFACTGN